MSVHIKSNSLATIYRDVMQYLQTPDFESAPRGKPIREFLGFSFELTDPRNRLITSQARDMKYGFCVGELCWYLRGDTDLETMLYYNKRMGQFSDDGKTINSAYGARIFNNIYLGESPCEDISQFDNVISELARDPDSRRAVMHINQPRDLHKAGKYGSKDVPCTMSIQLFIRNRLLFMHVLMRSGDVVWGLGPDCFSFTCLQEVFLYKLQDAGVPVDDLGSYMHTAGSLHVYEPFYKMSKDIAMEDPGQPAPMKPFTLAGIEELAETVEPFLRRGEGNPVTGWMNNETEIWMVNQLTLHRLKRDAEQAESARKIAGLDELTRLTEELGLYDTPKDWKPSDE